MTTDNKHVFDREQAAFTALPVDDLCAAWQQPNGFEQFLATVGKRKRRTHTLCKVHADCPWGPDNCEWVTVSEAASFADPNAPKLTFRGVTVGASRWAHWLRVSASRLYARMRMGIPAELTLYHGHLNALHGEVLELVKTGAPVAVRLAKNEPRLFTCTATDMQIVDKLYQLTHSP